MKLPFQKFLALLVCVQATVAFPAGAEESILHPDSVNGDAGWALSRVGMNFPNAPANSYAYPDTTVPVRLYLIDTAVANPASFVAANPKLTFEGPISIVSGSAPTPRAHGTQMLSLICGVETGLAPGTPMHVVNYDIYPNSETTTNSLLNQAIIKAIQHHRNPNTPKMRAAICIATSSTESAYSYQIADSINVALAEGIPVILSAGNIGHDAATIVPSSNGTKEGAICVGASDGNNVVLGNSNFGAPVDILAPGYNVPTRSVSASSPIVPMMGTSPAAALVAGSVLAELSINGSLTPAQVESAIVPASGPRLLRTTYASTVAIINPDGPVIASDEPQSLTATTQLRAHAAMSTNSIQSGDGITPSTDSDTDGIPDMVEIFHSGHCNKIPGSPVLSVTANNEVQYKFPIAFDLFKCANPFELGNGYTWGIRCTSNFKSWTVPEGSLSKTTDSNGQNWLIATFPAGAPSCYVQIEIHPPAP